MTYRQRTGRCSHSQWRYKRQLPEHAGPSGGDVRLLLPVVVELDAGVGHHGAQNIVEHAKHLQPQQLLVCMCRAHNARCMSPLTKSACLPTILGTEHASTPAALQLSDRV
jgi:hypothetical protein